ncbi:MAG: ATP-binding cassette domain-containing protein [Elusimicrobia bacterium]|nr:ATP-binding cassette domain-containing protein [Elusimicrobiota bacterium]MBD3411674.1 ATP-binding cassette domain-containing protein [Elusimicrobiota bacterium]
MMGYLRLDTLSKQFGTKAILQDINLDVDEETFCVFLGPSGSGKSTLLNIVAGLEKPTGGRVFLKDRDITDHPPHKRDVAMVFQNYALYPHLNVYENLAFGLRARKTDPTDITHKVREASRILNISDKLDRYPRQLSGGERQRVATGRAIVRDPNLFLFDEPLSNLDARLRLELRREFLMLHKRLKKTSLYVTHDQTEALSLGDVIVVLNQGRIQQISSPRELYDQPRNLFVAGFVGSPPMNILEMNIRNEQGRLLLSRNGFTCSVPDELVRKISAGSYDVVFMGIRPSAVVLTDRKNTKAESYNGEILLHELLGQDSMVYIRIAGMIEIKAIFPAGSHNLRHRHIQVILPQEKMYFFDREGQRL